MSAAGAFDFQYDGTGPVVTATPARSPDSNGWYNHALSVTFNGTDATSGLDTCVPPQIYSGPDNANASVSGNCSDIAGNTTVRAFGLSYDATAPQVTPVPERAPNANGWFNHPLRVVTDGVDATSGLDVCTPPQLYSGPDNENALVSGDCTDRAGNAGAGSIALRYDATGPIVAATPARAPDANGWYNHALTVSFSGTDATSGIEACAQATYSGPDSANASVSGTCNDRAGNATPAGFLLKYDATAPAIGMLVAKPGKRSVELLWRVSSDAVSVELARAPGTDGAESVIYQGATSATSHLDQGLKAGRTYRYRLTAADEAANRATRTVDFVARGALLFPAPGERVSKPPLLVWTPVKGARYYNVILMRGRRVFSAWPVRARLQLRRTWTYRGSRYKLRPGLYRWFVWPGRGRAGCRELRPDARRQHVHRFRLRAQRQRSAGSRSTRLASVKNAASPRTRTSRASPPTKSRPFVPEEPGCGAPSATRSSSPGLARARLVRLLRHRLGRPAAGRASALLARPRNEPPAAVPAWSSSPAWPGTRGAESPAGPGEPESRTLGVLLVLLVGRRRSGHRRGLGPEPGLRARGRLDGLRAGGECRGGSEPEQPDRGSDEQPRRGREPLSRPPEVPQVSNRLRHEPPPGRLAEVVVADLTPIVNGEALRAPSSRVGAAGRPAADSCCPEPDCEEGHVEHPEQPADLEHEPFVRGIARERLINSIETRCSRAGSSRDPVGDRTIVCNTDRRPGSRNDRFL